MLFIYYLAGDTFIGLKHTKRSSQDFTSLPFHGFYEWAVIYSRIDSRETRMALEIIREEILKTAGEHSLRRLSPRHVLYAYTYTRTRTYISVQRRGFAFVHRSMAVNLPRLVGQTHNSAANGGKKRKKIHAAAKSPFPAIVNFINGQISVFIVIWYRARSRAENKGRRIKTVVRLPFDYTLGRETWAENRLKTRGCDRDCSPLYPRDAALSSASIDDLDP